MAKKKARPAEETTATFTKVTTATNDVPTYYVNSVHLDLSSFDVRFRMAQILGVEDGVLKLKEVAYVFMSHAHFRAFADVINKNLLNLDKIAPPKRLLPDDKKTH
jgi:hypothetical protein